ncbi:hypothetical protein MRAB57_3859 [Mycobacterium rhizamassiliense]|jgi:hypothetical protein|uniref:CDGP domain-containing protein n=1 Tax=Mycobacterium rhizamassiliense TaxID=1841860 RepID=A0A2U3NX12_9MYCO|nr:hypothetical protein [Mycobacterium rhizamassiliense]SPM36022.1 hypothetical protein MRAB57_3859 [Mycobacterium rhizamassiliense]
MKRCIVGGLAALLMAGGQITSAPPASAGCVYGGNIISKCDGPIQPDGTWQRCVAAPHLIPNGASSWLVPERQCNQMGPGQFSADLGFADPPTHIDG